MHFSNIMKVGATDETFSREYDIISTLAVVLKKDDTLILGAGALKDDRHIDLKEVVLKKNHQWNGLAIRELDISRQTIIVMIKRSGTMLVPNGNLVLMEGDHVILYSQERISHSHLIEV